MFQLNLKHVLERANVYFGKKEIVSRRENDETFRYNYGLLYKRVGKLANLLKNEFDIQKGDRIASLCWNTHKHLELHFAVPCIGAVLHTVNLRFSREQIVYSINHAHDRLAFVDSDQVPLIERIASEVNRVERFVSMGRIDHSSLEKLDSYEDLLDPQTETFDFPDLDETLPAVTCYTTGTTGEPKGALYTHRGIFLRSMATCMTDTYRLSENDTILHVVPMYHISGWFMPYAATLVGSKQVFPGAKPSSETYSKLIEIEAVTVSDGVPAIWMDFLNFVTQHTTRLGKTTTLRRLIVGGSAPPTGLLKRFNDELGVEVVHAWGMTETYDSAVASRVKSYLHELPEEAKYEIVKKQGLPFPCIEVDIISENGEHLRWDGVNKGELIIRGAWVIDEYFKDPRRTEESFIGEWLRTGDVAIIDEEGYVDIVDRLKDLIKSGGEWISSIELENQIMNHPAVLEAAVISTTDAKWGERPVALVVPKPDHAGNVSKEEILSFLQQRVPKWWLPAAVIFVKHIAKTSVGKIDKKLLRAEANYPGSDSSDS